MITRLILKGFLVIPDLDVVFNSNIIQIVAKNGKGKSLLMSLIHPLPKCGNGSYPIKKGEVGYKEIEYKIKHPKYGNLLVLCQIEYTPNRKDSHSAKAYLKVNFIDENRIEDLNPAGNVDAYILLVREYLFFESQLEIITNLNQKSCGIVTSTPQERLDLFKILISDQMKIIDDAYENVKERSTTANALIRSYNTQLKNLPTKESITKEIDEINQFIKNKEIEKYNATNLIIVLENKLKDIEKDFTVFVNFKNIISKIYNVLKDFNRDSLNFMEVYNDYQIYNNNLKSKIDEMNNLENSLLEFKNINFSSNDNLSEKIKDIKEQLNNLNEYEIYKDLDIENIKESLKSIYNIFEMNDEIYTMSHIFSTVYSKDLSTYKDKLMNENIELNLKIDNILREKVTLIDSVDELLNEKIIKKDNCITCPLYLKYERSLKEMERLKNLEKEYQRLYSTREKNNSIIKDLNFILPLEEKHNLILSLLPLKKYEIFKDIYTTFEYKVNNRFKISSIFLDAFSTLDCVKRYKELKSDYNRLLETESQFKNTDTNKYFRIVERINVLKNEILNLDKNKIELKIKDEDIKEIMEKDNFYRFKSFKEIKEFIEYSRNVYYKKKDLTENIEKINDKIYIIDKEVEDYKKHLMNNNIKLEKINQLSEEINKLTQVAFETNLIKDTLDKFIPVEILSEVCIDIENMCNSIFSELNIDFIISIIPEDKSIGIQVSRDERVTPDSKLLSSGETCIVASILNAAIKSYLHYPIIKLDEIDAPLDYDLRKKYNDILYYILNMYNIDQLFLISHRTVINDGHDIIVIGDYDLSFNNNSNIIRI